MDNKITSSKSNKPEKREAPFRACYNEAQEKFRASIISTFKNNRDNTQQLELLDTFLQRESTNSHSEFDRLQNECRKLAREGEQTLDGEKANKLLAALTTVKTIGDGVISMAPETVSIVWFGISSILTVATIKLEIRLLICDTCESITSMVQDCLKWEMLDRNEDGVAASDDASQSAHSRQTLRTDIWESGVTELLCSIFDFLWHAQPHQDPSRLKRFKSTIKEAFTKDLQQKVDNLIETYEELVKQAQTQFQELILENERETRARMLKIREVLNKSVSIASEMLEGLQSNTLYQELKAQRDKISEFKSHQLHFESLDDRARLILEQRKGHVANWFFKDPVYQSWTSADARSDAPRLLCLESPRGHGKSTIMLCLRKKLAESLFDNINPTVLYFFFKKGDQEIQITRTALQSIVHQLLGREELRNNFATLRKCVEILNPTFGKSAEEIKNMNMKTASYDPMDIQSLCEVIRQVGDLLPRVYLLVDALDECQDRVEKRLVSHLMSIVRFEDTRVRLILSVRNTIDIKPEMELSRDPNHILHKKPDSTILEPWISPVVITSEKNSSDLKIYLTHDVSDLLDRRIDQSAHPEYYAQELQRIVNIIHQKANGDFALARMIIANLQQPSKLSLEDKILRLPAAIGEIYMTALESLKTEEQELVVTALKWVVWAVSAPTVVEISDHYREIYRRAEERSWNARPQANMEYQSDHSSQAILKRPDMSDPREEPEVKEIIHHLETIGRDFFRIDRHTGLVTVDISIREWIQEDSKSPSRLLAQKKKGFDKYRDEGGYTVFKFTLTPSFVRYGDSLMELFDEREAQMAITLDILRTLNNPNFQDRYMPWEPEWAKKGAKGEVVALPESRPRYEIEYWHQHLKILGNWWSEECLDDPYWSELLTQLSTFSRPENWYRWIIQLHEPLRTFLLPNINTNNDSDISVIDILDHIAGDGPIQISSSHGLNILIDSLLGPSSNCEMRKSEANWFSFGDASERIGFPEFAKAIKKFQEAELTVGFLDVNVTKVSMPDIRMSPLQLAVNFPSTVECLIKHGADINSCPSPAYQGSTLLWALDYAHIIRNSSAKTVPNILKSANILIRYGAKLDASICDYKDTTLLHQAARMQDLEFFKLICFSINWSGLPTDRLGETPLHSLFSNRPETTKQKIQEVLDICQILVQMGTKNSTVREVVNAQDALSRSPLMAAVENVFLEGIIKLIELGVDIHDDDGDGNTCFHGLAQTEWRSLWSAESIRATADLLFGHGLDITRYNYEGLTAFMSAFDYDSLTMLEWLLEKFSEWTIRPGEEHPFIATRPQGEGNVLHFLSTRGRHLEVIAMMQRYIPESVINEASRGLNKFGQTPLMVAAKFAYKSSATYLRWLLDLEVNRQLAGLRDQSGWTALDYYMTRPEAVIFREKESNTATGTEGVDLYPDTFWKLFRITPKDQVWSIFDLSSYRPSFWQDLDRIDPENLLRKGCVDGEAIIDEHGWRVGEIIDAGTRPGTQHQWGSSASPSLGNVHKAPSRLSPPFAPHHDNSERNARLSGNGLSLSLNLSPESHVNTWVIATANHPVPQFGDFYFEATFSFTTAQLSEDPTENESQLCLATRSRPFEPQLSVGVNQTQSLRVLSSFFSGTVQWWEISHPEPPKDSAETCAVSASHEPIGESSPNTVPQSIEITVGLGVSAKSNLAYLTTNGQRLRRYYTLPFRRYFPTVSLRSPCETCTINFGSSPFKFEPANSPDWELLPGTTASDVVALMNKISEEREKWFASDGATDAVRLGIVFSEDPEYDIDLGGIAALHQSDVYINPNQS